MRGHIGTAVARAAGIDLEVLLGVVGRLLGYQHSSEGDHCQLADAIPTESSAKNAIFSPWN